MEHLPGSGRVLPMLTRAICDQPMRACETSH
jgi:hypothetical protein